MGDFASYLETLPVEALSGQVHEGPGPQEAYVQAWEALGDKLADQVEGHHGVLESLAKANAGVAVRTIADRITEYMTWCEQTAQEARDIRKHLTTAYEAFEWLHTAVPTPEMVHNNQNALANYLTGPLAGYYTAQIQALETQYWSWHADNMAAMTTYRDEITTLMEQLPTYWASFDDGDGALLTGSAWLLDNGHDVGGTLEFEHDDNADSNGDNDGHTWPFGNDGQLQGHGHTWLIDNNGDDGHSGGLLYGHTWQSGNITWLIDGPQSVRNDRQSDSRDR